jgi:hypothetical protein
LVGFLVWLIWLVFYRTALRFFVLESSFGVTKMTATKTPVAIIFDLASAQRAHGAGRTEWAPTVMFLCPSA